MDLIKDDVRKLFYKLLIPSIGGAAVVAAYSFVDTIAIGQGVGPNGTAACAVFLPIFTIADFIGILCGTGGSILYGKAKGSGQTEKANAYFTGSILLVLLGALLVWALLFFFQNPVYRLFGADEVLLPYVREYGGTIIAALPSFVLIACFPAFLNVDGVPNLVLIAAIAGAVLNIFGDWFFVFPLDMGMFGAALATVLGSLIQLVIMGGYVLSKRSSYKFVKPYKLTIAFRKTVTNGFGTAFSSLAVIAMTFVVNNQIMKYADTAALAVYGMLGTVTALLTYIYTGTGQAVSPIASSGFGAGKPERYWESYRLGIRVNLFIGVVITAICMLVPGAITALFIKVTPEIMEMAPMILRIYAVSFLPLGINSFLCVYLQSIMRAEPAAIIAVMRGLIVNCALLCLLPLAFGATGIWTAFATAEVLVAVIALLYLHRIKGAHR